MYLVGALLIVVAIQAAAIVALLSERRCARVPSGLCATGHDARLTSTAPAWSSRGGRSRSCWTAAVHAALGGDCYVSQSLPQ
jgi:hypothetical protein